MITTSYSLEPRHREHLLSSAISDAIIEDRGYYSLKPGDTTSAAALLGIKPASVKPAMHEGALVIPLHRLGEDKPYAYVLRPDRPITDKETGRARKYLYPTGMTNVLDALPRGREILGDPQRPIWLTEGAKKADALSTVFDDAAAVINLNGVYGWRTTNKHGGKVAAPELQDIAWNEREVYICPDGDYQTNPNVQRAINGLAQYLAAKYRVSAVWLVTPPQPPDGEKVGVDDYLAQGGTIEELISRRMSLQAARETARIPLLVHPDTGCHLFLPTGYEVRGQEIVKAGVMGLFADTVYAGNIFVRSIGQDVRTGQHTVTISWQDRGELRERTVPRELLSNRRAFSDQLGGSGADLHEGNISEVMKFLGKFVSENTDTLPRRLESNSYGFIDKGLVLADGAIGFDGEPVACTLSNKLTVGEDAEAYPATLHEVAAGWDVPVFWLALSLALAGPIVARMRPRRNPVLGLFGESGGGKTTTAMFATGAFGQPERMPLKLEAYRSTVAGLAQSLEVLGGLPLLIDEAHTAPDPAKLEGAIYTFANGQSYTRGGPDGRARGGEQLAGTLILCAEAVPEFRYAGSRNRVLFIDTNVNPPLGVEPRSEEGARRARVLETAWANGYGLFASRVLKAIWADWEGFKKQVDEWKSAADIAACGVWRDALAIAAETLMTVFSVIGIEAVVGAESIISRWAEMLASGHKENDPAGDAFDKLKTMLAQARLKDDRELTQDGFLPANWEYLEADRGGGVVACRKVGESYWRVLTSTPQFQERVGAQAPQLHGREWVRRGWVLPSADGKTTSSDRIFPRGTARVLRIPGSAFGQEV